MSLSTRRAAPLPAEERRAALIAATLPLVLSHGADVSTRQIAEAAGVAEGTIFRVFASKDDLIQAAMASAFDPDPVIRALSDIDRSTDLRGQLVAAVEILQRRVASVFHLMAALSPAERTHVERARHTLPHDTHAALQALADLFAPAGSQLRCDPLEAARRLWLLTFANSHPRLVAGDPLPAAEVVALLLDGIRLRPECGPDPLTSTAKDDG